MPKIVIPVATAAEFRLPQIKENYFIAVVPVSKLPLDKLPLDANLRRPNKKAKITREILSTLMNEPGELLKRNLGITLIAESAYIKYHEKTENPASIWVDMINTLHGVANGGHTLTAIKMAIDAGADVSAAYVDIKIIVGIQDESLKETVVGLNSSERVDQRSILYKQGMFKELKSALESMGYNKIHYYQNQAREEGRREDTRQSIVHVLKLLCAIDKKRSNPDNVEHPTYIVGGGSNVIQPKSIERAEDLIFDFLPVAIDIEKRLYILISNDPRKLPGVKSVEDADSFDKFALTVDDLSFPCSIPSTYSFPVVSAFRAFIENDHWVVPIEEIIEPAIKALWKEYSSILRKEYDHQNRSFGGIIRNTNIWIKLYNIANNFHKEYLRKKIESIDKTIDENGTNGKNQNPKPKPTTPTKVR